MIESGIREALAASAREVLETMFFVDLPDLATGSGLGLGPGPERIAAQVNFDGDPSGSFLLELDMAVARALSADFLSQDPSAVNLEQINEVVCELSNMICGSVLSRIESSATFRLAKPEIAVPNMTYPPMLLGASFQARLDAGALRAEIRMERPVCPGIDEHAF